ncbi:Hly-III related protein [Martensiomyces pterosporus]|nr:Hly-III related protein [Martensiomyces pterosporus]
MSVFQIPAFMVEDYIMGSYRPLCFSYRECLQSWGYVHSELGNIMTHLVGAIIFICLALITGPFIIPAVGRKRPQDAPRVNYADYAVVYTYLAAVLFCLLASVAFHTLACHSPSRHFRSLRCDFIGILVLIAGSFVPMLYYGFFHSQKILISYMVMILALAAAGVAVSIAGRVEDPRRQAWRPVIFMGISVSGLIPLVHGVVINGYSGAVGSMSLWYVVGMGILYIAGTSVYAFKIPERYRPGKHNVLLQSHQIFHTFVVLAALCHFIGIVRALMWTHRVT